MLCKSCSSVNIHPPSYPAQKSDHFFQSLLLAPRAMLLLDCTGLTHLNRCEVLELPMWVWDQMLWFGPVWTRVNPDFVALVCTQQLGTIRWAEVSWERGTTRQTRDYSAVIDKKHKSHISPTRKMSTCFFFKLRMYTWPCAPTQDFTCLKQIQGSYSKLKPTARGYIGRITILILESERDIAKKGTCSFR